MRKYATCATAPRASVAETVPIDHETSERVVRTLVVGVPPAALALGAWLAWGGILHWQDLLVLVIMYTLTGAALIGGLSGRCRSSLSEPLCQVLSVASSSSVPNLDSELTKVMIDVEVGPAQPRGLGHPAEYRMRAPVCSACPRGDAL